MSEPFKYRAFISYSHVDTAWGSWLHKGLEKFRIHKKLVGGETAIGKTPKKLGRVFRDDEELGATHALGPKIESALSNSDTLIVLCSPNSARSEWVNKEIAHFKALGRHFRIFALIIDGKPNSDNAETECFPTKLIHNLDGTIAEPLAIDVRKFGRDDALIRLVSGILDIDYDELKQREQQRRKKELRRAQSLFATGVLLIAFAVGTGYVALKGIAENAHKSSDLIAREASILLDDGNGDVSKSLLMALQADPAAARNWIRRFFDGQNGYADARHALTAALAEYRFERRLQLSDQPVRNISSSLNGEILAVQFSHEIFLYNTIERVVVAKIPSPVDELLSVALSPDGEKVAAGLRKGAVRVWETKHANEIWGSISHEQGVWSLAFSSDNQLLISASDDKKVIVWDAKSGDIKSLLSSEFSLRNIAVSPTNDTIAVARLNGAIEIWSLQEYELLSTIVLNEKAVWAVSYFPTGTRLSIGLSDGSLVVWDVTENEAVFTAKAHNDSIRAVHVSPDGRFLITGSEDGTSRVFESQNGTLQSILRTNMQANDDRVESVTFVNDGGLVVTSSVTGNVYFWKFDPFESVLEIEYEYERESERELLSYFDISPNGKELVLVRDTGDAEVVRLPDGDQIQWIPIGTEHENSDVSYSPDGKLLAFSNSDGWLSIWSTADYSLVHDIQLDQTYCGINAIDFSPTGEKLSVLCEGGELFVLSLGNAELQVFETECLDFAFAYSPVEPKLACGTYDGRALIISDSTGETVASIKNDLGIVFSVAYSPGGERLLVGGSSGVVNIWDISSGELALRLLAHEDLIFDAAYSDDGELVLTASHDGYARVWDSQTGLNIYSPINVRGGIAKVSFLSAGMEIALLDYSGRRLIIQSVPDIINKNLNEKIAEACSKLADTSGELSLSSSEVHVHKVLRGEPLDQRTGDFLSPC